MVKKKTIMESFFIDELSGVDCPAQEGAKALIIKRAGDLDKDMSYTNPFMLSDVDGHSHIFDDDGSKGGETSWTKSSGDEGGHTHPWIRNIDGNVVIGLSSGHTHTILEKRFKITDIADPENAFKAFDQATKKGLADWVKKHAKELGADALKSVNGDKQMAKEVEMVEKSQLDQKDSELAIAKAFGALNDAEKAYYYGLEVDKQDAFMKLDSDGRKNELKNAQDADPVVYKDHDGNEFRKSDDPRTVAAVKRADKAEETTKRTEKKFQDQDLEKRADSELNFLPGDVEVKRNLIKAVDGIEDATVREGVQALLKAGNEGMSKAFSKIGTKTEQEMKKTSSEYEKLSEEYAKDNKCSIEVARAEVLEKTEAGRELYKRIDAEKAGLKA